MYDRPSVQLPVPEKQLLDIIIWKDFIIWCIFSFLNKMLMHNWNHAHVWKNTDHIAEL